MTNEQEIEKLKITADHWKQRSQIYKEHIEFLERDRTQSSLCFIKVKIYDDGSFGRAYLPSQINEKSTPPPGESYREFVDKILWNEVSDRLIKYTEEIRELKKENERLRGELQYAYESESER